MGRPVGRIAPGPRGHPLIGNLIAFRRDVLRLLLDSRRDYGNVVRFRLGPMVLHLVSHPDHIRHVLVTGQANYDKDTRSSAKIRATTGPGLLTTSGDFWLRQRRMTQPALQPSRVASFIDIMTETTAAMLDGWQAHAERGTAIDVASEMMRQTCTIVGRALLGADVRADLAVIEEAATVVMAHTWRRLERILDIPLTWPTPGNRRFRCALRRLDEVVYRIIRGRQAAGAGSPDLLSMILHRRDEETGEQMTPEQVRNETVTLLLAGHETTANALTWTWYLLGRHPQAAEAARAEVRRVLGDRPPAAADLPHLEFTTRVLQEALRLYPPIWVMERRAIADDTIAGYHIPAGSSVIVCPYVTHRHPDFWDDAERFDPDRFLPERAGRPAAAYLPFGAGPRHCVGSHFAMTEALVILAMVLQRYGLALVSGHPVEPLPGITLRTRYGLRMTVRAWPGAE
jgi:cytochrome P450